MKAKKERKVEIYIINAPNPEQRLKRIIEILAEGVFNYLFREESSQEGEEEGRGSPDQ